MLNTEIIILGSQLETSCSEFVKVTVNEHIKI